MIRMLIAPAKELPFAYFPKRAVTATISIKAPPIADRPLRISSQESFPSFSNACDNIKIPTENGINLVAKFLEEKTQLLAEEWKHTPAKLETLDEIKEEPKDEIKEEPKEEVVPEKPKKKSTAKKSTTKKSTSTKKKKASESVDETKE